MLIRQQTDSGYQLSAKNPLISYSGHCNATDYKLKETTLKVFKGKYYHTIEIDVKI